MNKQQLASKIWESANKMRSKIEANEYKDYILGFIFYIIAYFYFISCDFDYKLHLYILLLYNILDFGFI